MKRRIGRLILVAALIVFPLSLFFSIRELLFSSDALVCERTSVDGTIKFGTELCLFSDGGWIAFCCQQDQTRISGDEAKQIAKSVGTEFVWADEPRSGYQRPFSGSFFLGVGYYYFTSNDSELDAAGVATTQIKFAISQAYPLTISFLVLAMAYAMRRAARKRSRIGLCPNCGYDLRATPDRCPECGSVPNLKS